MVFKQQKFHETDLQAKLESPPHAMLEHAVSDALASAGGIDASDVTVTAKGSMITLRGVVQLEEEVERAEDVARHVAGVSSVLNGIRFTGLAG